MLAAAGTTGLSQPTRAVELLKRPRVSAAEVLRAARPEGLGVAREDVFATVEVELKYSGYVARERARSERLRSQAGFTLRGDLPYMEFRTVSFEAREKLARVRPGTLAQAGRIPGGSPVDLQNLMLEVRRLAVGPSSDSGTEAP